MALGVDRLLLIDPMKVITSGIFPSNLTTWVVTASIFKWIFVKFL